VHTLGIYGTLLAASLVGSAVQVDRHPRHMSRRSRLQNRDCLILASTLLSDVKHCVKAVKKESVLAFELEAS